MRISEVKEILKRERSGRINVIIRDKASLDYICSIFHNGMNKDTYKTICRYLFNYNSNLHYKLQIVCYLSGIIRLDWTRETNSNSIESTKFIPLLDSLLLK